MKLALLRMTLPPGLHTRQMTGGPLENMPELRISAKHESFLPHVNRVCGRRRVRAYAQQSLQADPSKRDSLLIPMKKGPSPMSNGTSLKPRDRVSMSLNHEKPDRCPMQISFTPEFAQRLREDMHQTGRSVHNPHGGGNTYELERALGQDLLLTSVGWANSYYANETYAGGTDSYTDEWGVSWKNAPYETRFGAGFYTDIVGHPLADEHAVASYRPPDPHRPELYGEAERLIAAHKSDYWIVGVTVTTIFETAWALRGLEQMMIDFTEDPRLAETILDIPFRYHLAAAKRLVELGVDMIWTGDDVGMQHGMMISPNAWRRFLKPRMAEFISTLKAINPEVKIAYHSDGNIERIIPELIEIGLDVLNPVQPACMDPAKLKREYGDKLCFWGCIDEQHTLPFGAPDEVRAQVLERLETVGYDGGLILSPTHHVQLDTPLENFWALVHAIDGESGLASGLH
ncbi:MAG: uroporphyrinogen decarboxylase family protein [Roseiarcus sp.]|uniref:uroporphyrinogen decarboxylase family protein n=1 Tax=Roseiarcus sp. TaxID=1969460 RepID=UPI003C1FD644